MKKTNIKDLINLGKGFIDNEDNFKFEYCQGIGFEFNGRESFYGYYDCINKLVEYINEQINKYNFYNIIGNEVKKASIEIENDKINLLLKDTESRTGVYEIGNIDVIMNRILTFDKIGIFKNGYKQGDKFILEVFMSWVLKDKENNWPIGSIVLNGYDEYLSCDHWNAIRMDKIEESDFKCQLCGNEDKLNVHHNNYDNLFMEAKSDLIVLCESCHKKFHDIV